MGQAWRRLREDEDFLYDHRSPCPELPGYAVDLVLRGHEFCRCQLSGWVKWFLPHSVDRSAWPWSSRRVEAYVRDLLRIQPDYVAMGYSSYGYVVTVDGVALAQARARAMADAAAAANAGFGS